MKENKTVLNELNMQKQDVSDTSGCYLCSDVVFKKINCRMDMHSSGLRL